MASVAREDARWGGFRNPPRVGFYFALLSVTNHSIDERQYTIPLTAVVGSAVVPTLIAQRWFRGQRLG